MIKITISEELQNIIKEDFNKTIVYDKENSNLKQSHKNMIIEADNLEALKYLKQDYSQKIKFIYIDPPYNTHNNFMSYSDSKSNNEWLEFLYPRLFIAKELLKDDGFVAISIHTKNVHHLRLICDDIFGINNFVTDFIRTTGTGGFLNKINISSNYESTLIYAKDISKIRFKGEPIKYEAFIYEDEKGSYKKHQVTITRGFNYDIINPKTGQISKPSKSRGWRCPEKTFNKLIENGNVVFSDKIETKKRCFFIKKYKEDLKTLEQEIRNTKFIDTRYASLHSAKYLKKLFDGENVFFYSKPWELIYDLIEIGDLKEDDIILDFFGGSGTTADAVLRHNVDSKINKNFILVQIKEKAFFERETNNSLGFTEIIEITKKRIDKVIDILDEKSTSNDIQIDLFNNNPQEVKEYNLGYNFYRIE